MGELFRPRDLRAFLESIGHSPRRILSQNFLIDGNIVQKTLDLAELQEGDVVLEIGPGPGVLTQQMLRRGVHLIAVEKDRQLAAALGRLREELPESRGSLTVIEADVQDIDFETVLRPLLKEGQRAKVVANLPYHLTTPIITSLVTQTDLIERLSVMVQLEVAERFVADPGGKDYGSISVFLRAYSNPQFGFKVRRQCFYPAPKVDSAVVRFDVHAPPLKDMNSFFKLTRGAFNQRRKMLRASLKNLYPSSSVEIALESIGLDPQARPERLSLEQFLELYQALES